MSSTVAFNPCAEMIHHASDGILEQRWLPGQTTEGSFKATLALLALEAERLRPSAILIWSCPHFLTRRRSRKEAVRGPQLREEMGRCGRANSRRSRWWRSAGRGR